MENLWIWLVVYLPIWKCQWSWLQLLKSPQNWLFFLGCLMYDWYRCILPRPINRPLKKLGHPPICTKSRSHPYPPLDCPMIIPYELLTNQSNSSDIAIFPSNWHINRHGKIHAADGSQRETIHTCWMFNPKPAIIICGFHSFEVFSTNNRYSDLWLCGITMVTLLQKSPHLFQSSPIPRLLGSLTSTLMGRGRHFVTKLTSCLGSNTTMSIVYIYILHMMGIH